MNDNELISKKELLKQTGISYGQLYRWKRQNLIPDSWFIKQSSFTGQETFFPREKIFQRISTIMNLKDQYSLEELAELLNPETASKRFMSEEIKSFAAAAGISPKVIEHFEHYYGKNLFTFIELLFMTLLSRVCELLNNTGESLDNVADSIHRWLPELQNTAYRMIICHHEGRIYTIMLPNDAPVFWDSKLQELAVFQLDEISKQLNTIINTGIAVDGQ